MDIETLANWTELIMSVPVVIRVIVVASAGLWSARKLITICLRDDCKEHKNDK